MKRVIGTLVLFVFVATAQAPYDRYGGWTQIKGRKTGFFRTQKIGGQWWLVTPEGNAFFSKGVCHVAAAPESDSSPPAPVDMAAWARRTAAQLRLWGLNTIGAWSAPEMDRVGFAYAPILNLAASTQRDLWLKGGVPDVFSPRFRNAIDSTARRQLAARVNDPYLLGYFTDNEMRWSPDGRSRESLLESYLKMPPESEGYKKARAFEVSEDGKARFLEAVAGEYARVCHEAIRRYDTHHMIIGCRFAGYAPEPVLRGVARYFDVISYNNYSPKAPVEALRRITEITGKPTMVTEFSFKAMDSGLPNTKGAAKPVATQQNRADGFADYVEALAGLDSCVGYHWFQYRDQPKEGRRLDGENSNYGLVRLDFTPWETLTARVAKVNRGLEKVRAGR